MRHVLYIEKRGVRIDDGDVSQAIDDGYGYPGDPEDGQMVVHLDTNSDVAYLSVRAGGRWRTTGTGALQGALTTT